MYSDKMVTYRLFLTQSEIDNIADEMEIAFANKNTYEKIVCVKDYQINFVMVSNLFDERLSVEEKGVTLYLRYTTARQIAEEVKKKYATALPGDDLTTLAYYDGQYTILKIIAKQ